ncbi:Holliday junction branch migration DNA helicase RuvB [Patescibacteria group bacterium]
MSIAKPEHSSKQKDMSLDVALRPTKWGNFIGQDNIKKTLKVLIDAAKNRSEVLEHVLFYGPAGLGKTTLAYIIAKEMGAQIKVTSGPAIERAGDLASLLTNLEPHDILFIDETHRLNKLIEEILYPAMESRTLDIVIGKGPSARTIQLELPPFTLVAATTRVALLSSPLRSRFSGGVFRLDFYTEENVEEILRNSCCVLNIQAENPAISEIAKRSRFTPRVANRLLKRCRDVAEVSGEKIITKDVAFKTLKLLSIDEEGLEAEDRKLLETLIVKFRGGPVGLNTLAASISEESATIEEIYEPYLLQLGFIERTPRGRIATTRAFHHLGKNLPEEKQSTLLS